MLEQDTRSFLEFFNKVKKQTNEASKVLEDKKKERNEKTTESRVVNDKIQTLKTQINKDSE
jgi:Na+/phosphate symporter